MAVTQVDLTVPTVVHGKTLWHVSAYSADWSGAEVVKAAPTTGAIYVTRMLVAVLAAITVTIGDGEATSAVETIAWNLEGLAGGVVYDFMFDTPVKLTDAKALTADASGAGSMVIEAEGFISPEV
jgi:hypothetical protein